MKLSEALEIVFDLAKENALDFKECGKNKALLNQAARQNKALNIVHDFIVNTDLDNEESSSEED